MGRPKIGSEYKKSSDYKYDFPENRQISLFLRRGDKSIIAEKTGYTLQAIRKICKGERRMKPEIKQVIEQLILVNEQISKITYKKKQQND